MSRLVRWIAALALAAAAQSGAAYTRETTTPGHPGSGLCLWWRARQVQYRINAASANPAPCGNAATAADAAAAGIAAWGTATREGEAAACTDFQLARGADAPGSIKTGNDGMNLVVFRSGLCSALFQRLGISDACSNTFGACGDKYNCFDDQWYGTSTIGFTITSFNSETGELYDADMELSGWDGQPAPLASGRFFTCVDQPPTCDAFIGCDNVDVTSVATHEAGHMLGLDHVCGSPPYGACPAGPTPIMNPFVGSAADRGLKPDDVDGVCTMYPKGANPLTCLPGGAVPPPESPGGGGGGCCSSAGGTGVGGLLVAAAAFATMRARRRRA